VTYPGFTPVGNATLVVANVLTCNKHSHIYAYSGCRMHTMLVYCRLPSQKKPQTSPQLQWMPCSDGLLTTVPYAVILQPVVHTWACCQPLCATALADVL
jgi:hypothetical protein